MHAKIGGELSIDNDSNVYIFHITLFLIWIFNLPYYFNLLLITLILDDVLLSFKYIVIYNLV